MNLFKLITLPLLALSAASCTSLKLRPDEIMAKALTTTHVLVKTVDLRVHTSGSGKPESSVSSAEISVFGTSNQPDIKGFRLVFVPSGHPHLRQPYREGDHWTVLQELNSLDGWITSLKDIRTTEGLTLTLFQTEDGAYTLTALRRLTRL